MKNNTFFNLILCCLLLSCTNKPKEAIEESKQSSMTVEDKPVQVRAVEIKEADFSFELISNGVINSMNKADLRFQSNELIEKIYVKNGDRVNTGQAIALLDKFKLSQELERAAEAKERAFLDLQDVLIGQGYSLKDSLNIPANVMRIAKIRSSYDQSLNNYALAKYNMDHATLRAPFSGVVANLWNKEHNYPNGEVFCTVLDNSRPEVLFNILESEIPLVNINDKIIVTPFSASDFQVEGRVVEINPLVDKSGFVKIKASIPNRENKLYEGMNVKVRVQRVLGKRIVIPKTALVLRDNRKVVFTVDGDRAYWNYVETAEENSDSYVITEGIKVGHQVIYSDNINLAHESKIILRK